MTPNHRDSVVAVNERSPLLDHTHVPPSIAPDVAFAVSAIANIPINEVDCEQLHLQSFANDAIKTAFSLVVLLQLRRHKLQPVHLNDVFETWSRETLHAQEAKTLEDKVVAIWDSFIQEYRTVLEIETVLWSEFPAQEGNPRVLRVVDFLVDHESPTSIVSHPIIMSGFAHTWQHGFYPAPPNSGLRSVVQYYDAFANPRASHFIELSSHMGFLALLSHYLLHPYEKPHTWDNIFEYFGLRECFLVFLPFSFTMRAGTRPSTTSLLVPLSFLFSLPYPPSPGDFSFTVLLWGFFLHVLQLHLPNPPSPLFLLPKRRALPFAVFLSQRLTSILYPVMLFFLPTFLLASFLLSISLVDTFGVLFIYRSTHGILELPSPTETRLALFAFFVTVIGLAVFSAFALATSPDAHVEVSHSWGQYSEQNGLSARKSYYRAVKLYTRPHIFPPPFNILHLLLIRIPGFLLRSRLPLAKKILWRIAVGPFVVLSALLLALGNSIKYFQFE